MKISIGWYTLTAEKYIRVKLLLDWARAKYPKLLISFIPAGCTEKFQPADLIL
jgi:hypothetical protein